MGSCPPGMIATRQGCVDTKKVQKPKGAGRMTKTSPDINPPQATLRAKRTPPVRTVLAPILGPRYNRKKIPPSPFSRKMSKKRMDPGTSNIEECFVAGTKIIMKDGPDKNIQDIKVGDKVLSYNVHTKQFDPKEVTKLFTQIHDLQDGDTTVKVTFDNGIVTHNTIANPFWSKDKGFVAVDAERCNRLHEWVKVSNYNKDTETLKVGDTLFRYNNDELEEVKVIKIELILEPDIRTYDIQVEENHTFFADSILTHNSAPNEDDPWNTCGCYICGFFAECTGCASYADNPACCVNCENYSESNCPLDFYQC